MRILSWLAVIALGSAGVASADPGSPAPAAGGGWGAGGWSGVPPRATMPVPPMGHPPVAAGQLPPPGHPQMMHGGRGGHGGGRHRWYGGWRGGSDYRFIPGGPFGGGYYYWPQPQVYYGYPEPAYGYAPPPPPPPPPGPPPPPRVYTNPTGPITVPAGTTVIVKVTPKVTRTVTEEWVYPRKKGHWSSGKTKLRHR